MPETERSNLLASFSIDFTDTLGGFVDVSWANVKGVNSQDDAYFYGVENYCIAADNAYIQGNAALQSAIAANVGNGTFFYCFGQTLVRKDFTDDIKRRADVDSDTWRVIAGLDGQFGDSTWNWEGSVQLGQTKRDQIGYEYPSVYRYQMAIDAVLDGSGNTVCRVTRDGASALPPFADPSLMQGCVPINIIGNTPLTRQQIDYAWGPIVEYNTIDQEIVSGSVSGEILQGWAGPLLGAFGVEIRNEELQNDVNEEIPEAQRIDIAAQYGDAFGGKVDVTEAFIELEMPLLADKPGAELLSINAAYRDATYETTDTDRGQGTSEQDVESWKVALIYDPLDWLRFRGSKSRDVRAAGFRELYWQLTQPAAASGFGTQTNPWKPDLGFFGSQSDPTTLIISGDVALRPEKADTTTYGLVITPTGGALEGFRFSVDYWEITINDGIQGGGVATRTIQNCYQLNELCDLITFADNDPLSPTYRQDMIDVRAPSYNARRYDATGLDFSFDYSRSIGPGTIAMRLLTTRALETIVRTPPQVAGGPDTVRDIAGQTGSPVGFFAEWAGSPDFSHNLVVTYMQGPFSITTQGMYISEGRMDKETPSIGPNEPGYNVNLVGSTNYPIIPEHLTWNMTGTYRLDSDRLEGTEFFMTVENIADKDPKFSTSGLAVGGAYPVYYPALGRTYRLGARLSF
jgi:outer membrane receptor protein involved in Fe transport